MSIAVELVSKKDESSSGAGDGQIVLKGYPTSSAPFSYTIDDGATWQASETFNNLISGPYVAMVESQANPGVYSSRIYIDIDTAPPLSATYTKNNVSVNGGSDGYISVTASGGSGNYSYVWADDAGETGPVRENLPSGDYTVTVKDTTTLEEVVLNITISEPELIVEEDPYFDIPVMQSIHFTPNLETDELTTFETADNKLLNEQKHPNFRGLCYFQKIMKGFSIAVQVHSNMQNNIIEVYNEDNELVDSVTLERVAKYTGIIEQYAVRLANHGGGQSRVYFTASPEIPTNINEGDVFEIINNVSGFNGLYEIVGIDVDLIEGSQYLIINKNFGEPENSFGDAIFSVNTLDYDVYEGVIETSGLSGYHYLKAYNDDSDPWYSELIKVVTKNNKLNLIEFTNADNAFGIDYSNNITHRVWVNSLLFKRVPTVDKETLRNTDGRLNMLSAKPQRKLVFEIYSIPAYLIEKLAIAFSHDVVTINGVEFISPEGLEEPEYIDKFGLASTRIIVEQRNWLNDYNGNDIGGVNIEQGYLVVNDGFLKL